MSNCEVFQLPELEAEAHYVREVLRCLLHTIVFNRALGLLKPKEVDSDLFEVTYVQCGEPQVERLVEEKISSFLSWTERNPGKQGQVVLSFYEKRRKQGTWFTQQEERLYWEQWYIQLNVAPTNYSFEEQNSLGSNTGESAGFGLDAFKRMLTHMQTNPPPMLS